MPKSKPYYVDASDRNIHYTPKDDPSRKSKQRKRIEDRMSSTKKSIDSTDDKPLYKSAIIIGRSNSSKLLTYMNEIHYLMNLEEPLEEPLEDTSENLSRKQIELLFEQLSKKSQQSIVDMYDTLRNEKDEIICKKEAYRRMKSKAVTAKYTIRSDDNSKQIHPNSYHLAKHLKAYLYAMIYPPIFENCTPDSSDVIFSKYPALLELWCNMLEEAIILDGFLDCLHKSVLTLLDKRYDSICCNNNEYDVSYIQNKTLSQNFKNLLINLYIPNIKFSCRTKQFASENNADRVSSIEEILKHQFFQSGNRGSAMLGCIKDSTKDIDKIYSKHIKYLEDDYIKQIKNSNSKFNDKINSLTKIFSLYNLSVQSHLLDFVWHAEFDRVDFHLTQGFMTNYVLHKIMKQNILVIEKISETHEDEEFHYGKKYICTDSTELSLSNTIETYDLHFLRLLIKQCSDTFRKYDLRIEENLAKSLIYTINDTESILFDDFFKNIIEKHLLNNPIETIDKLEKILEESKDYYHKIYEDNYNWHITFS